MSQLANRVGEGGGVWQLSIALHSLTLPGPGNESREGGCVPSPWPYGDFFKAMDCNVKT